MPTTDPNRTCPALAVLRGTMRTDDQGRVLLPAHAPDDTGHCGHCGATSERTER